MEAELEQYIEEVHNEPFNYLSNNCVHKHTRIVTKARELGYDASLMGCIAVIPVKLAGNVPIIGPHAYAKIDSRVVDVSMQPCLEEAVCKNEDMIRLLRVNVSKIRPMRPDEGPPLPTGYFPPWPWVKE